MGGGVIMIGLGPVATQNRHDTRKEGRRLVCTHSKMARHGH
jgi:hypothetical protein